MASLYWPLTRHESSITILVSISASGVPLLVKSSLAVAKESFDRKDDVSIACSTILS